MIEVSDLERLLASHEQGYHAIEKSFRIAIRLLLEMSDPQQSLDGQGFNKAHYISATTGFLKSCNERLPPLTGPQINALTNILYIYQKQLSTYGLTLPTKEEARAYIQTLASTQNTVVPTTSLVATTPTRDTSKAHIDIRDGDIYVAIAKGNAWRQQKNKLDEFKNAIDKLGGHAWYTNNQWNEWKITFNKQIFSLLLSGDYFPTSIAILGEGAKKVKGEIEAREIAARHIAEEKNAALEREIEALLAGIGGIENEVAPGFTLYPHQRQAVHFMLRHRRCIIGDETGVGKTGEAAIAAKALQKRYEWKIYVITTKSSIAMWHRAAERFGVYVEVYGWAQLAKLDFENDEFPDKYILIVDESHNAANIQAARTKKFLEFSEQRNCMALYCLTGTPMPNSLPWNMYPLLYAAHHPLVWGYSELEKNGRKLSEKEKRTKYQNKFCGRRQQYIGDGKYVFVNDGATEQAIFHRLVFYKPESNANHKWACTIARRKIDCVNMPSKERMMDIVDLTDAATAVYKKTVVEMWEGYQDRIKGKLVEYRQQLIDDGGDPTELLDEYEAKPELLIDDMVAKRETLIRAAEKMVLSQMFRHAGAVAKIDTCVERAAVILDRGAKLVIFTHFLDVAAELGKRIAKESHVEVGYILGSTKQEDRQKAMDSFQSTDGKVRVIIASQAGGESVDLNGTPDDPCQYMILHDRLWTVKDVQQEEGRCWRINNTGSVTVYWLQMPAEICPADAYVDSVLQRKQINTDLMQFNEVSTGMTFATENLDKEADAIIRETYLRIKNKRK